MDGGTAVVVLIGKRCRRSGVAVGATAHYSAPIPAFRGHSSERQSSITNHPLDVACGDRYV